MMIWCRRDSPATRDERFPFGSDFVLAGISGMTAGRKYPRAIAPSAETRLSA
jgi:hypothetical protein